MAEPHRRLSPTEYLALERQSETKSEYHAGETFAMAGASRALSLIVSNLVRDLGNALRGRPCEVHAHDLRVRIEAADLLYAYPDVVVVCGEPRFEDFRGDTLLNPTAIVEVLSPSTADYDLGGKAAYYRTLESLAEYLVLAQDRVYALHWLRQPDGSWRVTETTDPAATIELTSLGCALRLAEVYERVLPAEVPS